MKNVWGRFSLVLLLSSLFLSCTANYKPVVPGLNVLLGERLNLIYGKRVGIITNQTAITRNGTSIVDTLTAIPGVKVTALFGPEHGIRGDRSAGAYVESYVDSVTGITVYSLYGKTRKPTPAMLDSVDVLLFDIQDIGARFYTYISTMGLAMEAAAEKGIPFIVLDRPNPITGDIVEGPILEPELKSFVGMYPIPIRHGLTIGELARMINGEGWLANGIQAELTVVPMKHWRRPMWFDQTGLKWIKTSPNMPDLTTAILYPGMCLTEATNVSEGRGTEAPFRQMGAPWINGDSLKTVLSGFHSLGVLFSATEFTPEPIPGMAPHPKYENELCSGLSFKLVNRNIFRSVSFGVELLSALHKLYPDKLTFKKGFDRLAGTPKLREQILRNVPPKEIVNHWTKSLTEFKRKREKYLLYR
ncbi:hypothetical protein BMS3Abin05_02218 [bacterium BMS3Abin05]|nr:hypothetical protein BMS3Abin05_02218 [bacterium BMS3Abin05]GBE26916.1 hypothetical protein BMS3Bbin03_00836 [bacterium BMS3Bbin03]